MIRFTVPSAQVPALLAIGEAMNELEPEVYEGPRPRGDGFVCDLSRSDVWSDHLAAMKRFLARHQRALADAAGLGASLTIDVAVDKDDQARVKYLLALPVPSELVAGFAAARVAFEFSLYRS